MNHLKFRILWEMILIPSLKAGMTLAIEPMVNMGTYEVELIPSIIGQFELVDHKYSAHFEHTIVITESEPEILTLLRPELLPEDG